MRMASERPARPTAAVFAFEAFAANAPHFDTKSAGTEPIRRPRRSFTWLEKMITAIPLVNPVMTG